MIGAHQNGTGTYNQFLRGFVDEVRVSRVFRMPAQLLQEAP